MSGPRDDEDREREKKVFRANKDDDDEQGNDALALTSTRSVCVLCLSWALAGS